MYVSLPYEKKDDFELSYTMTDSQGTHEGIVFDKKSEDGTIKGSIQKRLSMQEASQAMQVIDSEVTPEERRGLITRIREFFNKVVEKIKGRNESR